MTTVIEDPNSERREIESTVWLLALHGGAASCKVSSSCGQTFFFVGSGLSVSATAVVPRRRLPRGSVRIVSHSGGSRPDGRGSPSAETPGRALTGAVVGCPSIILPFPPHHLARSLWWSSARIVFFWRADAWGYARGGRLGICAALVGEGKSSSPIFLFWAAPPDRVSWREVAAVKQELLERLSSGRSVRSAQSRQAKRRSSEDFGWRRRGSARFPLARRGWGRAGETASAAE